MRHIPRLAMVVAAIAAMVGVSAPNAAAYRKAHKAEARALKVAERNSPDGRDAVYRFYVSTVRRSFATGCVDRPGYSNTVMGRSYVRRHGRWRALGSFNTGNIDSGSAQENYWEGPVRVYRDLQKAIARCAHNLGADY